MEINEVNIDYSGLIKELQRNGMAFKFYSSPSQFYTLIQILKD